MLSAWPVHAEHIAGGGGTVSISSGGMIYSAAPIPGGINAQILVRRLSPDGA